MLEDDVIYSSREVSGGAHVPEVEHSGSAGPRRSPGICHVSAGAGVRTWDFLVPEATIRVVIASYCV